jgi:hypothetical protein
MEVSMAECHSDTEAAMTILLGKLNKMGSDAEQLCQRHLNYIMAENKFRDWDNKSTLYAQTRIRGYGLTVNWYEVKWYGQKATKTRRMVKTLIRKPAKSHSYNPAIMAKHTQPWEEDMVREVEAGVTEIRRKVSALSKALLALKQLERLESE